MKTNGNDPSSGYGFCTADGGNVAEYTGLTKREHFAAMAMQGLLASNMMLNSPEIPISHVAVSMADSLINQLNK